MTEAASVCVCACVFVNWIEPVLAEMPCGLAYVKKNHKKKKQKKGETISPINNNRACQLFPK